MHREHPDTWGTQKTIADHAPVLPRPTTKFEPKQTLNNEPD